MHYRIRPSQQSFAWLIVVKDHINRVQIAGVNTVPLQQRSGKVTLERRKTKSIVCVSNQKKLVETIAQSANAIVKHNRIGFSWHHS